MKFFDLCNTFGENKILAKFDTAKIPNVTKQNFRRFPVLDTYIFLSRKARKNFLFQLQSGEGEMLFTELTTRGKSILKKSHVYVPFAGISFRKAVPPLSPKISQAEPLPPVPLSV